MGLLQADSCKYALGVDMDLTDIVNINILQLANTFPHYVNIKNQSISIMLSRKYVDVMS